jgi:cell division protein FtsB
MNRSLSEEYEEVESPYAQPKERLRNRKNVFNRPFAANPSVAPAVFETTSTSTRKSIGHPDFTDMVDQRAGEVAEAEIEYLEEGAEDELDEVEKKPVRSTSSSAKKKSNNNIVPKILWSIIGLLVLRLICMDRGVWDYFAAENTIQEKREELKAIGLENKELKAEVTRIQMDGGFQRQLAKEHLGVIAADEFLILFAGESSESAADESRNL